MSRQQYLNFIGEWKRLSPVQKQLARKYIGRKSCQTWDRATPFTMQGHYGESAIHLTPPTMPQVRANSKNSIIKLNYKRR